MTCFHRTSEQLKPGGTVAGICGACKNEVWVKVIGKEEE